MREGPANHGPSVPLDRGEINNHFNARQKQTMTEKKTPLKIAILGTAQTSQGEAPFDDESWEIWGLSTGPEDFKRITRHFEIHDLKRKKRVYPKYYEWMTKTRIPVYLDQANPNIPTGVVGWEKKILERFGPDFHQPDYVYMTNSISWMIGQAIIEIEENGGVGEIGLWGVEMAIGSLVVGGAASEYAHQRPSCEYWIGLCRGLGIKCSIPENCNLLNSFGMYGFDTDNQPMYHRIFARNCEIDQKEAATKRMLEDQKEAVHRVRGGLMTLEAVMQNGQGKPTPEEIQAVIDELKGTLDKECGKLADANNMKHVLQGAASNQDWLQQGCPPGAEIFA